MITNFLFLFFITISVFSKEQFIIEKSDNDIVEHLKKNGLNFNKEKKTCFLYNQEHPLGICEDLINFANYTKELVVDTKNEEEVLEEQENLEANNSPSYITNSAFLKGSSNLKKNTGFLLSEISGISYRQIDLKKVISEKDLKKQLKDISKKWDEIDYLLSTRKTILSLNNLNYLDNLEYKALLDFIVKRLNLSKKSYSDNLLIYGTSVNDNHIPESITNFFEKSYSIKGSDKFIINNDKISYDDKVCKINNISYPSIVCEEAISFMSAVNESKKHFYFTGKAKSANKGASRILLYGEPGNGKTTMGKVFADIFKAKMIFLDSAGTFKKHYGESEEEIQKYFNEAKALLSKNEKVVLIIDEIDAIGYNPDKVRSEGAPKVSVKLQTCIDDINNHPNSKHLIIIATTNRKAALSAPISSRFSSKVEILKPENSHILAKILESFNEKEVEIDPKGLLKGISKSKSFRECILCAEQIEKINSVRNYSSPKELSEKYQKCIASLQMSYSEYFWSVVDKTSEKCSRINPVISSLGSIHLLVNSSALVFSVFKLAKNYIFNNYNGRNSGS